MQQVLVLLVASLALSAAFVLEVKDFGVFQGTEETSTFTDQPFYAFRSIHYGEQPTNTTRFLVILNQKLL